MKNYDPKKIEKRWQKEWESQKLFIAPQEVDRADKMYILPQLPYPSGSGLHVGHAEVYTACDIYARYQRMLGKKVLQVIGWDSFGLPAENYAIKTNVHPKKSTEQAIDNFRKQIKALGISVDWEREVGSHNPDYYKWTQWFFLLMYKRGLAYRKKQSINWCESCKTVLANEQVVNGSCERCDTEVKQREMEQWFLKITDYADRLEKDLDKVDWPEETKRRQRNWIGRSEGASIKFKISNLELQIEVFTTRPDTLFGATYLVLAPEHVFLNKQKSLIENWDEVEDYVEKTKKITDLQRQSQTEKTGVELKGVKAINPADGKEIPVWIADFVLNTYGTGAIMAVPAHDERDFEFATKFGLPVKLVVTPKQERYMVIEKSLLPEIFGKLSDYGVCQVEKETKDWGKFVRVSVFAGKEVEFINFLKVNLLENSGHGDWYADSIGTTNKVVFCGREFLILNEGDLEIFKDYGKSRGVPDNELEIKIIEKCFSEEGVCVNSDFLSDLPTIKAKEKMITWLEENKVGERKINYKLRDWSVSRQRFWGAPIPMLRKEQGIENKEEYVLVHGYTGAADDLFFPWLKKKLESLGHRVWCENLPNTNKPNIDEQVRFILDNTEINENTVLLGHSLGGSVVMRLLENLNKKVNKVLLVDAFSKPKFSDKERPCVEQSFGWKYDFNKIKSACDDFVLLMDKNFPIIPEDHAEELAKSLDARYLVREAVVDHFCAVQEPQILENIFSSGLKQIPEEDLPVILPDDVDFKPTGESPLNYSDDFQKGVTEKYGEGWRRETDTLDTFMCSSWYYFRYLDPKNDQVFASPESLKKWMPVDFYLGGEEHVNGHLLYSRFFTKVLFDAGYVDFDEPFLKTRHQGLILGEDGRKMSKRWGNVVNPTDVVEEFGADTCRVYEMFMGSLEDTKPWSTDGVRGIRRFLDRVYRLQEKVSDESQDEAIDSLVHKTLKKVGDDLALLKFNTAIAKLMELSNEMQKLETISRKHFSTFVLMISPFAPHLAEEMWQELGNTKSLIEENWPEFDETKLVESLVTMVVQINGKVRASLSVSPDIEQEKACSLALQEENVIKWLAGKEPKKIVFVKGKLISIVV